MNTALIVSRILLDQQRKIYYHGGAAKQSNSTASHNRKQMRTRGNIDEWRIHACHIFKCQPPKKSHIGSPEHVYIICFADQAKNCKLFKLQDCSTFNRLSVYWKNRIPVTFFTKIHFCENNVKRYRKNLSKTLPRPTHNNQQSIQNHE